ncbi:MAG: DmsE family decaheme c-type cytochrome [Armatimonadota bacterium]
MAEQSAKYVGTETCATCHEEVAKKWELSVHRRTLFNKDASQQGCEACHGPGGDHVAGGGDKTKIINLSKLNPTQLADICLKCHTQGETTLWHTSTHARGKLSCNTCHDPHSVGDKSMLQDMEDAKLSVEGLSRAIKQAELAKNIAPEGSEAREAEAAKVEQLKADREQLQEKLKGVETVYQRTAEPYVCYTCHKTQQVQANMPSRHPIREGKVQCSSCHNPHGGPNGMLRKESIAETCRTCHADKAGPFVYEHPPVAEDCTICHSPHGSVQNKLLKQSQPFLCLKCHAMPHSRRSALSSGASTSRYLTECTDCHNQIHGSDTRPAFRH